MNQTVVAKNIKKFLVEKYGAENTEDLSVMNKTQTRDHGYVQGCPTLLWEEGPHTSCDCPWTYDCDGVVKDFVDENYPDYYVEAYNSWMLCVWKVR